MKLTSFAVAVVAVTVVVQSAEAREHVRHRHYRIERTNDFAEQNSATAFGQFPFWQTAEVSTAHGREQRRADGGLGGRPAAWCGWQMRQLVSADPGPSYNLARNWAHYGRPGPAGIGAIVVWPHHVGKIVGQENGQWVVESGNDGHALRSRPRSIAGIIAVRWG